MRKLLFFFAFVVPCFVFAQQVTSTKDFATATGTWMGKLRYVDYTSGKPTLIPVKVNLQVSGTDKIILSYDYPNEPNANSIDTLLLEKNGSVIAGARVIERSVMEDGTIRIVTEKSGTDGNDNKKAKIRRTYYAGKTSFQIIKAERFENTNTWIHRSAYIFERQ